MADEIDDEQVIRPFTATLQELDRGKLVTSASEAFHELIAACMDTGKAGSLTLVVKLEPNALYDDRFEVIGTVTTKLPQPQVRKSIMFADKDGNLVRNDPTQEAFEFAPVQSADKIERKAK